jgi:hypothetical protein
MGRPPAARIRTGARFVTYNGRTLPTKPPVGGMTMECAARQFRMSPDTIWKLIDKGVVLAGMGTAGRVRVRGADLKRVVEARAKKLAGHEAELPPDGEPITQLAKELGIPRPTLQLWCGEKKNPILDRPLRKGVGPVETTTTDGRVRHLRVLLVSRADVEACLDAIKNPLLRRFAANPGVWLAPGVFRHDDGRLFFTDRYIYDHVDRFGIGEGSLCTVAYRRQLDTLEVAWPAYAKRDRRVRLVFSMDCLDRRLQRRAGVEGGGEWLAIGDIWHDSEGVWYSSRFIAKRTKTSIRRMHEFLRASGLVERFKKVPIPAGPPGSRSPTRFAVVHHWSEVHPLIGLDGAASLGRTEPTTSAGERPSAVKNRGGRARNPQVAEVYEYCYHRWVRGDKLAVIRAGAVREFGEGRAPKEDSHVVTYAMRHVKRRRTEGVQLPLRR